MQVEEDLEESEAVEELVRGLSAEEVGTAVENIVGKRTILMVNGRDHPKGRSLQEVCAVEMQAFLQGASHKNSFDEHLANMYEICGGEDSKTNFPKSLYHLKQIIGNVDVWDNSVHVCPKFCRCFKNNDGTYAPGPMAKWSELTDVTCGVETQLPDGSTVKCEGKRFKMIKLSSGERRHPNRYSSCVQKRTPP
jgi:hypothetical protein